MDTAILKHLVEKKEQIKAAAHMGTSNWTYALNARKSGKTDTEIIAELTEPGRNIFEARPTASGVRHSMFKPVPEPCVHCIETVHFIVHVPKWIIDFQAAGTLALNKYSKVTMQIVLPHLKTAYYGS
ncbi:hypothetical protein [Niastella populi]|nr:hypothetical protein [Niastella populi]